MNSSDLPTNKQNSDNEDRNIANNTKTNVSSSHVSETVDPQKSQSDAVEKKEEDKNDLKQDIEAFVRYCQQNNVSDPVELLRVLQSYIVQGHELEPSESSDLIEGKTNSIYINRMDVLKSVTD